MASYMKSVFFILIIAVIFPQGMFWDLSLILEDLVNSFFPKNPGIVLVRKVEELVDDKTVLDFIGLVERHGYHAENHSVTTEDGYNLMIHRIPGSPKSEEKKNKKVVLFLHGYLVSSNSWVLFGPDKDLAFLLADDGYDVWLGNFRGNAYGRSHVELTTYNPEFWQFSFHEMGLRDLPTMFDYILNHTGQQSLHYIGHSMGTTSLFVLLSTRPEYNTKVKLGVCLSPITYIPRASLRMINIVTVIEILTDMYNIYDILPQSAMLNAISKLLCNDDAVTQPICIELLSSLSSFDLMQINTQINTTTLPFIISHLMAGSSRKAMIHYHQSLLTSKFQHYDYGADNYIHYKQIQPLSYDIKRITAPLAFFYGANDVFQSKSDVLKLKKSFPNVIIMEEVPYKSFDHLDFVLAIDVKTLLNDRIIQIIQNSDN